ncbi:MAG TPA: MgtC/SapB family protein [Chthoniobacterales bacterium]
MEALLLQQLAVSFGLGFLLGLERQRSDSSIAGIRTFPFISVLGTVCAQMAHTFGGWIVGAGLLALAAVVMFANFAKLKAGPPDAGMTTEVAALLLYAVGVLAGMDHLAVATVVGGMMFVLLHLKQPLHRLAAAVGERDMRAIVQFVVLSLIILPVLPHEDYGPYGVWNPFHIWLMVVLIVGISLSGYMAYKFLGARTGSLLGGAIGGLISSTATTVSFARRASSQATVVPLAAVVIMVASCTALARVLMEIAIVSPALFPVIAPPIAVLFAVAIAIAGSLYFLVRKQSAPLPEQQNPAELKAALIFGGLYALVLLAVGVAKNHFGPPGLFAVGFISGLTDMDAITLSIAQLAGEGKADPATVWRTILIAALANFFFKFAIVAAVGSRMLARRIGVAFGGVVAAGGFILWVWPG